MPPSLINALLIEIQSLQKKYPVQLDLIYRIRGCLKTSPLFSSKFHLQDHDHLDLTPYAMMCRGNFVEHIL